MSKKHKEVITCEQKYNLIAKTNEFTDYSI